MSNSNFNNLSIDPLPLRALSQSEITQLTPHAIAALKGASQSPFSQINSQLSDTGNLIQPSLQFQKSLDQDALQNLRAYTQQTKTYPDVQTYKPSRLRSILGDISGGLAGVLSLNPLLGERYANAVKMQPMLQQIQRYNEAMIPYKQRADIGMLQAQLGASSARNLYDLLRAQSSERSSLANELRASTPKLGRPSDVVNPNTGQVNVINPIINPLTGQITNQNLGVSPKETDLQKQINDYEAKFKLMTLQNNLRKSQLIMSLSNSRLIAARHDEARLQTAGMSNDRISRKINADFEKEIISSVPKGSSYWQAISKNKNLQATVMMDLALFRDKNLFTQNKNGSYSLIKNITPQQLTKLKHDREVASKEQIDIHNQGLRQAMAAFNKGQSPYSFTKEEAPK